MAVITSIHIWKKKISVRAVRWTMSGDATRVGGKGHTSTITSLVLLDGVLYTGGMDDKVMRVDPATLQYETQAASVKGGVVGMAVLPSRASSLAAVSTAAVHVLPVGGSGTATETPCKFTPLCVACSNAGLVAVGGKDK
eukprot:RCo041223